MDLNLEKSVVLITGGSAGIGAATAARLVAEGARVAICAREQKQLEARAAELASGGAEVLAVAADVTVAADMERFVEAAVDRWGRIDGFVNNAQIRPTRTAFEDFTDEMWQTEIDARLMSAVRAYRLILPHMRAAGGGAIVNVLPSGVKVLNGATLPLTAALATCMAITKELSREVGPDGIRVNAVFLSLIRTRIRESTDAPAGSQALEQRYEKLVHDRAVPLGRMGRAEEVGDTIAFLLSKRASYITGTAINIDGGTGMII